MSEKVKRYIWFVLFGISLGYLEAAVVVYLRGLCYPDGFYFPLRMPPLKIFFTEVGRELSTIIILLGTSYCVGSGITRVAYFLLLFGLWDICYYFWLYILLKWPPSFFTWDILFFIPITWAAPVIAPIIVSILFILYGILLFSLDSKKRKVAVSLREKVVGLTGLLLVFLSFTIDAFLEPTCYLSRIPVSFHWGIFISGIIISAVVGGRVIKKSTRRI
ncbi:MAG: hypothetical protein V2A65_11655 [Candidatus Omnitrophota bacterium]